MGSLMLQLLHSFKANNSKCRFISANSYEIITVSKDYPTGHHDDQMWFLPKCRDHIKLIRDFKGLL